MRVRWLRVSGASLTSCIIAHIWTFWPAPLMLLTKPCPDAPYDKEPGHDDDSRATLRAGVHRIYLPVPLDAHARAEMQTGLSSRFQSDPVGPLYGYAMEVHASTQSGRRHRPDPRPSSRCSRNGLTTAR